MIFRIFKTLSFVLLPLLVSSQSRQDYQWFFGNDRIAEEEGIQNLEFNFNDVPFEPTLKTHGLSFDQNNASICDKDGNLLMYTNGCAIANRDHEVMMNGDSINWGNFAEYFWFDGDCKHGYPGRQNITILPDPGYEEGYYILHKTLEYNYLTDYEIYLKYLKYTYIDMSLDDGKGAVIDKNVIFHEGSILSNYFSAIAHSNGSDYWIIQPKEDDNVYYRFLLTGDGIIEQDSQRIGPVFNWNASASGTAVFSPDGHKYAYYNVGDQLLLYDFNRETGLLSNLKQLSLETEHHLSSVEFSPNSELLYVTVRDSLYQVDTTLDMLEDGVVLIDTWNGIDDPFSTIFFIAALAPDCKIYIRSGGSTASMHVIHKPNEQGLACDFVQQGLTLPGLTSSGSFPNFPRFRVDEEEKCDPTITSFLGDEVYYRRDLEVYPNPVEQDLNITIPEQQSGQVIIYDMEGKVLMGPIVVNSQSDIHQVDVSVLSSGTYIVEYVSDDRKEKLVYNQKFVKM